MQLFSSVPGLTDYIVASEGFVDKSDAYVRISRDFNGTDVTTYKCSDDNLWYIILRQ